MNRAITSALLLLVLAAPAAGQSKTGTTVGQFLLIEPSARAAAMGNAGTTMFEEVESAFYNPGALGRLTRSGAQFTYASWLAGVAYNHAATAIRIGDANTLLLSVTSLNSGEIDVRTVDQPLGTGERYEVADLALGFGFGRRLTDRFSAGIQVKYLRESIWHSAMSSVAIDFGVQYQLPFGSYLGASLSNFGGRSRFDGRDLRVRYDQDPDRYGDNSSVPAALRTEDYPLPIIFRVGIGVPVLLNDYARAVFVVDALQPSDNTQSVSFGTEWMFFDALALRAGYQNLFQEDSAFGLTLGSGLSHRFASNFGFAFDYAWAAHQYLGDTHRFTVGVSF
ncbi:MAG: PorV/PorQ family protein [Rhodothermales bacterium]